MADNLGYTAGSGSTVATDEIAGVHHQRVKIGVGADGVAVDVSAANPLPVTGSVTTVLDGVTEDAPLPVHDESAHQMLTRLLSLLGSPMGYDKSLQRQRGTVVLESGTVTTVTTVTTVSAVTSLNNFDGYNARMPVLDQNRSAWAQCVRARIT